jgi:hypothetical protein
MDKTHILHEVKRTAAENGGVPLGWRRFLSETGIRQPDWLGIYRARWSEALREAGFVPNELTEAYGTTELLDEFAELAIALGRLPTNADIRLTARNDPQFPHDKMFRRLGSKAEIVEQLTEHCRVRKGFEEVVRWCEECAPRNGKTESGLNWMLVISRHSSVASSCEL